MNELQSADPSLGLETEIEWTPEAGPIDPEAIFGRAAPLVIEIGTGNGAFLAAEAERRPEFNYLGIEISREFFFKLKKRIARHRLPYAKCMFADAHEALAGALTPGSVARVVSNFSDPWPKRRHRERRVFRAGLTPLLERVLRPGGEVVFKSDVGWYFNFALTLFRRREGWTIAAAGRKAEPNFEAGEIVTNYERKAREAAVAIWGFRAIWRGLDSGKKLAPDPSEETKR